MVEIKLIYNSQLPKVISSADGNQKVVLLSLDNLGDLENIVRDKLSSDEYQLFINLWRCDDYPRIFVLHETYLIIRSKLN